MWTGTELAWQRRRAKLRVVEGPEGATVAVDLVLEEILGEIQR